MREEESLWWEGFVKLVVFKLGVIRALSAKYSTMALLEI